MRTKTMFNEKACYLGRNGVANAVGLEIFVSNSVTYLTPRYKRESDKMDKPASCYIQIPHGNIKFVVNKLLNSVVLDLFPSSFDYQIVVKNVPWYRFGLKSKLKSLGFYRNSEMMQSYMIMTDVHRLNEIKEILWNTKNINFKIQFYWNSKK